MTTAQEKMKSAARKLESHPELAASIGARYKFILSGEGGGTWIVNLQNPPSIQEGEGEAPCTIRLPASDYVDLLEGRKSAPALFFSGKIQIEGDLSQAMKLQALAQLLT